MQVQPAAGRWLGRPKSTKQYVARRYLAACRMSNLSEIRRICCGLQRLALTDGSHPRTLATHSSGCAQTEICRQELTLNRALTIVQI